MEYDENILQNGHILQYVKVISVIVHEQLEAGSDGQNNPDRLINYSKYYKLHLRSKNVYTLIKIVCNINSWGARVQKYIT